MVLTKMEGRGQTLRSRPFSLKTWLNARVTILSNQLTNSLEEFYSKKFDLNHTGWRILSQLGEFAPMSAKELGERIATDQIQISRACSRLYDQGLILRDEDPEDRRKLRLKLSAKGQRVYHEIVPVGQQIEHDVFSVLSPEELRLFEGSLDKIERRVRDLAKGGSTS
ncbi:winged helix-turn-helix transcriptional regulator [Bradyrhizobium tropiciagri]|uniref:MarR family winged helix-turn-helix transcriptional regulator n=1 Tax=Bradyrhizobium tropiciagri TaxID=312253 RepID=UPI001BA699F4|nr:MarR family winged helix-turn-helix transcriptional regulator [Bradyrhizobium tropiciagri]MBR0896724.1 winged helix-turn-helix transcriptional regulator [Bradyrhizobium tropiciagri]